MFPLFPHLHAVTVGRHGFVVFFLRSVCASQGNREKLMAVSKRTLGVEGVSRQQANASSAVFFKGAVIVDVTRLSTQSSFPPFCAM